MVDASVFSCQPRDRVEKTLQKRALTGSWVSKIKANITEICSCTPGEAHLPMPDRLASGVTESTEKGHQNARSGRLWGTTGNEEQKGAHLLR